jgi:hypothetical protein
MLPTTARESREGRQLAEWLNARFRFTHFITLATNDQSPGKERLRDLLKEWDARLNRDLNGPKWRKHRDELTYWFAFLEKPKSNPHWHLLFKVDYFEDLSPDPRVGRLQSAALFHWKRLVPSGSVSVKEITAGHDRVTDYVAKELGYAVQYEYFVVPDEFRGK